MNRTQRREPGFAPCKDGFGSAWRAILIGLVLSASATQVGADAPEIASAAPGELEFVGENLLSTANGRFHQWKIVDSSLDLTALSGSYAVVEVDLASIDTGIKKRDAHLRNADFFEVEKYPHATVRVHSARPAGKSESGHPLFATQFDIDLHGVQKSVEGEVELVSRAPAIFEGRLSIDRRDFGIGPPTRRMSPTSIKPVIPISFRIEADSMGAIVAP